MIRILNVVSSMNRGGAETLIMNIYRKIDRTKIQFDFVVHSLEKGDFDDEIKSLGGRIFYIPLLKDANIIGYYNAWDKFLINVKDINAVHIHMPQTYFIYASLLKKAKLVTIMHSHSVSLGSGIKGILKKIINFRLRFDCDYYFACSIKAGIYLFGKNMIKKNKVKIVKNGIETKKFIFNEDMRNQIRNTYGWNDKYIIGHVGRFDRVKNHTFLIDIFNEYRHIDSNSKLILVGKGSEELNIINKIKELDLVDSVEFLGVKENVNEILQGFDVFVFPSVNEGLGISIIEAQASGLSCFVSNGVTNEVNITGLVEFISLKKDAFYWADRISNLHNHSGKRMNNFSEIIKSGYEITFTAKELEKFYLTLF